MKKSIGVILLGSALFLPNHHGVEAAYSNNEVQVQKVTYANSVVVNGKEINFNDLQIANQQTNLYKLDIEKILGQYGVKFVPNQGSAVEVKPTQPKPQNPTPSKPVVKPNPQVPTPSTPVVKPKPQVPAPAPTTPVNPKPQTPEVSAPTQDANISAIEKAVLDLTNVERQKAGLSPLQIDSKLMNSARQKSTDMATKNYFSHTSPTYGSPFDQMKANGITYRAAAENIAMGQRSAEEVVKAWMESPGHRENILTPGYTHIGIGFDPKGNYWTQQFIQK